MWKTTKTFLRWIYSTRRMDARVVASEKCWSGVEEKLPEISREVHLMYCLRIGHVSTPKILMDEKSWKTWKSNQKIVTDEELVLNVVMDGKFVKNFVMGAKIDPTHQPRTKTKHAHNTTKHTPHHQTQTTPPDTDHTTRHTTQATHTPHTKHHTQTHR